MRIFVKVFLTATLFGFISSDSDKKFDCGLKLNILNGKIVDEEDQFKVKCNTGYHYNSVGLISECHNDEFSDELPVCAAAGCEEITRPESSFFKPDEVAREVSECKSMLIGWKKTYCDGAKWIRPLGYCREKNTTMFTYETESWWRRDPLWKFSKKSKYVFDGHPLNLSQLDPIGSEVYICVVENEKVLDDEKIANIVSEHFHANLSEGCLRIHFAIHGAQSVELSISQTSPTNQQNIFTAMGTTPYTWRENIFDLTPTSEEFRLNITSKFPKGTSGGVAIHYLDILTKTECRESLFIKDDSSHDYIDIPIDLSDITSDEVPEIELSAENHCDDLIVKNGGFISVNAVSAVVKCNSGFSPDSEQHLTCEHGEWAPELQECQLASSCEDPKVPHGKFNSMNSTFECDEKFLQYPKTEMKCKGTNWSLPSVVCYKRGCQLFYRDEKALIKDHSGDGGIIKITCSEHFTLHGKEITYCDGLNWVPTPGYCRHVDDKTSWCDFKSECHWESKKTDEIRWEIQDDDQQLVLSSKGVEVEYPRRASYVSPELIDPYSCLQFRYRTSNATLEIQVNVSENDYIPWISESNDTDWIEAIFSVSNLTNFRLEFIGTLYGSNSIIQIEYINLMSPPECDNESLCSLDFHGDHVKINGKRDRLYLDCPKDKHVVGSNESECKHELSPISLGYCRATAFEFTLTKKVKELEVGSSVPTDSVCIKLFYKSDTEDPGQAVVEISQKDGGSTSTRLIKRIEVDENSSSIDVVEYLNPPIDNSQIVIKLLEGGAVTINDFKYLREDECREATKNVLCPAPPSPDYHYTDGVLSCVRGPKHQTMDACRNGKWLEERIPKCLTLTNDCRGDNNTVQSIICQTEEILIGHAEIGCVDGEWDKPKGFCRNISPKSNTWCDFKFYTPETCEWLIDGVYSSDGEGLKFENNNTNQSSHMLTTSEYNSSLSGSCLRYSYSRINGNISVFIVNMENGDKQIISNILLDTIEDDKWNDTIRHVQKVEYKFRLLFVIELTDADGIFGIKDVDLLTPFECNQIVDFGGSVQGPLQTTKKRTGLIILLGITFISIICWSVVYLWRRITTRNSYTLRETHHHVSSINDDSLASITLV